MLLRHGVLTSTGATSLESEDLYGQWSDPLPHLCHPCLPLLLRHKLLSFSLASLYLPHYLQHPPHLLIPLLPFPPLPPFLNSATTLCFLLSPSSTAFSLRILRRAISISSTGEVQANCYILMIDRSLLFCWFEDLLKRYY